MKQPLWHGKLAENTCRDGDLYLKQMNGSPQKKKEKLRWILQPTLVTGAEVKTPQCHVPIDAKFQRNEIPGELYTRVGCNIRRSFWFILLSGGIRLF